jgi:hypothetical protein
VGSASAVTTTPARSRPASSGWKAGTSPGAPPPPGPAPGGWWPRRVLAAAEGPPVVSRQTAPPLGVLVLSASGSSRERPLVPVRRPGRVGIGRRSGWGSAVAPCSRCTLSAPSATSAVGSSRPRTGGQGRGGRPSSPPPEARSGPRRCCPGGAPRRSQNPAAPNSMNDVAVRMLMARNRTRRSSSRARLPGRPKSPDPDRCTGWPRPPSR